MVKIAGVARTLDILGVEERFDASRATEDRDAAKEEPGLIHAGRREPCGHPLRVDGGQVHEAVAKGAPPSRLRHRRRLGASAKAEEAAGMGSSCVKEANFL